jgi:hypothetical protein
MQVSGRVCAEFHRNYEGFTGINYTQPLLYLYKLLTTQPCSICKVLVDRSCSVSGLLLGFASTRLGNKGNVPPEIGPS